MQITLTLNPDEPSDLERTIGLLERLRAPGSTGNSEELQRDRVRSVLRGYGGGRLNYVRCVAEAAPGRVPVEQILGLFDSPKAVGGTHSSIERSWRRAGGTGVFIETDRHGDARMDQRLASVVLEVLNELSAT